MSNPYTGSVASSLRKGQLLLEAVTEPAGAAAPALPETALLEGALLHLWRAYRAFLAEQAHQLGFAGVEPESAQALMKLVEGGQKASAEVGELVGLMENPDSWLRGMETAWRGLWRLSSQPSGRNGGNSVSTVQPLIAVTELRDPAEGVLDVQKVTFWHRSLTELVDRQRAQGQEW